MRIRPVCICLIVFSAYLALRGAAAAPDPIAVVAEFDRITATPLWPGLEAQKIPIEIYDGRHTWLFRHPHPPQVFTESAHKGVFILDGRDASLTANTNVDVGGVQTAAVMLDSDTSLRDAAALVAHEAFHVFQREHFPKWIANEADLFVYPVDNAGMLQRRFMETEALRRALLARDRNETACWIAEAMRARSARVAGLPASAVAYERNTELNEGLATYIQVRAAGKADAFSLPTSGFSADAVRPRAYRTGAALALLLDRTNSGWQREMDTANSLDELLASKVYFASTACEYSDTEQASMLARAQGEIRRLKEQRAKLKADFLATAGWQIVILADPKSPLNAQNFDPLNVTVLGDGAVLHTRYLRTANDNGEIEVLGQHCLTQAAGEHPMFSGVRQLTVTGLDQVPVVETRDGSVHISASGVQATFKRAVVHKTGQKLTVELGGNASGSSGPK